MLEVLGSLAAALWAAVRPGTLLLGAAAFLFIADFLKRRRPKNFPPGPAGLPFVGNSLQLDPEKVHLTLQQVGLGEASAYFLSCQGSLDRIWFRIPSICSLNVFD
ncbi:hypothetical protein FD754_003823 [Muntiacus muntjak]|uniref:Uncharacterized protein n=1 Tax=Muntiacus muntjak TaxID=9888 RepID=A0A5N3WF16_MUNMU|nr:hypothetical protein FD754_003823 [Muntiacus muntjak]